MKMIIKSRHTVIVALAVTLTMFATSCADKLDEPALNVRLASETDYTKTQNMIRPLIGAYAEFYTRGWEDYPLISVRGDDVNAGGRGDQQAFGDTDLYKYDNSYWMYNSVWQNLLKDILVMESTREQIERYKEFAPNPALADQYIAESKVMRAFLLLQWSRVWGDIIIPKSSNLEDLFAVPLSTKEEVMQHISDQMDEAIPLLPTVHPRDRADIVGGVTRHTALGIKALANLEMGKFQAVADATGEIITSGKFKLETDYYNLFKIPGKLSQENLLELQYSDLGTGSGTSFSYLFAFFGPENWTPKVTGASSGWGFYEPSMKWIKFMLKRGETERLETSVLFTNRGITEIKKDPEFATLPAFVKNVTRSGDQINDFNREMFASGKHYLPSDQLTSGRTAYGENKNFICLRYAEILLMHAEALTSGANSSAMTADAAVNAVRARANMTPLSGVTNAQVMDEKFAELAMEWGTRYFDMIRLKKYDELSYDGRTFSEDKAYLPYPQGQVDRLPVLKPQ
ncbi:RagB/SusD family nutrient uptake outer membrane protein [Chryseolinea sp. T2]|uniref:RagB/SusD family nutrient uptake outer membrane protein n=1 Tax=Chryseolinea sp. T2 TaxID=3129255 RepID=UPI00307774A0